MVKGRAAHGRHRQDDVPLEHPRVEPLAHLAHPGGDGDCGTLQAQGRWTTHRHPTGALATVQTTLCERTHRVRAPTREPLRHQTIIVDRLIAQMGVCEPVPVISTHLLADSPVSCGCSKHEGAPRCRGPGAVQRLYPVSSALSTPHQASPDALHQLLRPSITVDAGIRKMQPRFKRVRSGLVTCQPGRPFGKRSATICSTICPSWS